MKDLEKRYKFKYLSQIAFESDAERQEILTRGLEALKAGQIPLAHQELGEKYRKEIEAGHFIRAEIEWVNRSVRYGLRSVEDLTAHQFVGEYTGIVRRNNRRYLEPLNDYCYEYPVPDPLGISYVTDATRGNWARFINHSSSPNLRPLSAFLDGFYHVIFLAIRNIQKGESLSYDYGPHYWYLRSRPFSLP